MLFVFNSIIERLNENLETEEILRVLWIDEEQELLVVVNIKDDRKMTYPFFMKYVSLVKEIESKKSITKEFEVDMRLTSPSEDYLDKYKVNRNRRWDIIKDIVGVEPDIYISKSRGELINMAHLSTGKPKKVIRDYLKKYWFYGKSINGLLDNYFECGVPGEQRIYNHKPGPLSSNRHLVTEADIANFKSAIRIFHKRQGMNITTTHERMCETLYNRGFYRKYGVRVPIIDSDRSPTLRQFRYWYTNHSTAFDRYSNKHGKRRATMDVRPMQGDATERANCVGAVFEVDATRSDIILVSFDRKTILGKPTLYVVMDVFSRLVVGYHASLASESWFESMVAMEHAATSKVENCARFGVDIKEEEWPCHFLPQKLVGDRGELKAQMSERFVNLNVDVLNAPSYRGDLKPFIEANFHITNEIIRQLLSGSTEAKQIVRGDKDPARESVWTIEEFNRFLIVYFMTYNKSALSKDYLPTKEMFTDQVELTPLKVWNWAKGKRLLHEKSRDEIRYNLLPRGKGSVTRFGIEFKDLCYTSNLGVKEGWFEGNGNGIDGQTDVEVSFDPRNCSSIFLKHKKGLIQCFLTGRYKEFEGLHFTEFEKIIEYRNDQIKDQEKAEKQHRAELHAFADDLDKKETNKTKIATKDRSFYARKQDKREARDADSKTWGAMNAMTNVGDPVSASRADQQSVQQNIIAFPTEEMDEDLTPINNNDIQAIFSRKNNERRRRNGSDE